ncbi:MAG: SMC-Scp complex subunit ScpB [Proteobacteria bacterium]|nr:SMC-Scp complex subunit ScpB [Cystobacterineae bacterium]MCL2258212.1 SMC-Scp complex subunit ScpB [Cystobacterineae bacterium]MCL2315444.1 SMC-Scp complex subunit ScpB [Pseudomonadota bacterium]
MDAWEEEAETETEAETPVCPEEIDAPEGDDKAAATFAEWAREGSRLEPQTIRCILESLLFLSSKPLSLAQLYEVTGIPKPALLLELQNIQAIYSEKVSGIVLHEVSNAWQLRTSEVSQKYALRFLKAKPQRLTRSALETLAIVAYRQPLTRPEIEDIRGVDSGGVLKALLERRLIKILGKKEEVGRPLLYGTTPEFLQFFSLKNLSALPSLQEFHELTEEHEDILESEAPPLESVAQLADDTFQKKLKKKHDEAEQSFKELEQAISEAEVSSKGVASSLNTLHERTE